ncbi:dehydrogenase/reductase SDR family member 4-like [Daphnia carinata]|uniref:dehydrogenase/reductase SDR family member 4-like n=1 Tax=Daphnia carinata TaxID=120202 RepID=UPI00257B2292|nr:dehydrogenase/reductase SDR family member 4-like [Daphnia carinata]XP_059352830.1 dehydrogenase/reductase SDR family member 4-like [Daphnia carinata]
MLLKSTMLLKTHRALAPFYGTSSAFQNAKQLSTYAEIARQRRSLQGRVAVLTASTDGIGFAMAQRLALDGAHVVISSRTQENVDAALDKLKSQGFSASGIVCHAGVKEDRDKLIAKAVDEFGGFDILVSNVAVNPGGGGRLMTCNEDVWDKIFSINLKSSFFLAKEALPYMEKKGKASIIFTSSIVGFVPNYAVEFLGAYAISKAALLALSKLMAMELGPKGIRVNCIAPGLIETRFGAAAVKDERAQKIIKGLCPLERTGTSEEMAGLASFLASDDSSYITGANIVAAGGLHSSL